MLKYANVSDILNASTLAGDDSSQRFLILTVKKLFKKQYSMVNNLTIWSFGFDLAHQWMWESVGILCCIWNTYITSKSKSYTKRKCKKYDENYID